MGNFRAIPTKYAGVNFRSRLEAKWAAFFDLLGFRWEYEPVEFCGWMPDFALHPDDGEPIYCEVKPVYWQHGVPFSRYAEFEKVSRYLRARQSNGCCWLFGIGVPEDIQPYFVNDYCFQLSIHVDYGVWSGRDWTPRKTLSFDRIGFGADKAPGYSNLLWREACNRVQWKVD